MFLIFKGPVSVNLGFAKYNGDDTLNWLPEDGVTLFLFNNFLILLVFNMNFQKGFVEHLISTSTEWIFSILLMIFLLTFVIDFRRIKIKYPTIINENLIDRTMTEKF